MRCPRVLGARQSRRKSTFLKSTLFPSHYTGEALASDRQGMQRTPGSARILPAWTMVGLPQLVHARACGPGGQDARAPWDTSRHTRLDCQEDRASNSLVSRGMSLEFPVFARCGLTPQAWAFPFARSAARRSLPQPRIGQAHPGGARSKPAREPAEAAGARGRSFQHRHGRRAVMAPAVEHEDHSLFEIAAFHAEGGPPARAPRGRQ